MVARVPRLALGLFTLAALLAPAASHAVNLVPNPGFESYTSCPTSYSQSYIAAPWDTPNTGTSDYLNACAPVVYPSLNVPQTEFGFQAAYDGVGFAGLIPYSSAPDYREYVTAPLTAPMQAGMSYLVQFRVSLADSASLAVDRLGAYLSVGPVGPVNNYAALPYTPQIESPANVALSNSTGWTLISGIHVAVGGENHITIGSFRDDGSTNLTPGPGAWLGGSYYFVDGVSAELSLPTEQACCMSDGSCSMQYPGECTYLGGSPAGPGTTCTPNPCNPTSNRSRSWGSIKTTYR